MRVFLVLSFIASLVSLNNVNAYIPTINQYPPPLLHAVNPIVLECNNLANTMFNVYYNRFTHITKSKAILILENNLADSTKGLKGVFRNFLEVQYNADDHAIKNVNQINMMVEKSYNYCINMGLIYERRYLQRK
jgi:hypothetical protein